jgi:hypothetical protein
MRERTEGRICVGARDSVVFNCIITWRCPLSTIDHQQRETNSMAINNHQILNIYALDLIDEHRSIRLANETKKKRASDESIGTCYN